MSTPIISIEGLSKRYRLGVARHDTLRDRLTHAFRSPIRRLLGRTDADPGEFWALRDVSFSVQRGEIVGIVGRNGAGKSTLLKILSRITEPTLGRVVIRGRVASLLEVGTGFHPELSGRENIFLNGAILGMSRAEIRKKFDEIVDFAGVERFIETPVKHYSSGMYVRLAFSVAAHLEPEILIVDEVLAVGDAAFQRKCLGKIDSVAREQGRTVLFVSHNLHAVRQLCHSAVLLQAGQIQHRGRAVDVIEAYTRASGGPELQRIPEPTPDLRDRAYFTGAFLESTEGATPPEFGVGEPWRARLHFRLERKIERFVVAIGLVGSDGVAVQSAWSEPRTLEADDYEAVFVQHAVTLAAGSYSLHIGLSEREQVFQVIEAARLHVTHERVRGYYQATSGMGLVLNSMHIEIHKATVASTE